MNRDEILTLSEHLQCLGTKALTLDRYLQRKAWGIYYSVWAASILLFILIPYPIGLIRQPYIQLAAYVVLYMLIMSFAFAFSWKGFSKAERLSSLERDLSQSHYNSLKQKARSRTLIYIVIMLAVLILSSCFLRSFIGALLEFTFLALVDLYLYSTLGKSLGKIPIEGLIAVSVFMFSDIGSFLILAIFRNPVYISYFWIPTILVWFFASIYSLYHASDGLSEQIISRECN